MKPQPANQNKPTLGKDSFQKNLFIQQKRIRKYINHLHHDLAQNQMAYIREKFDTIEKSLQQEMRKGLEAHFQLLQQKPLLQKLKTFCSSKVFQFYRTLKIKKHKFLKISSLKRPSLKFTFEREEIISLFVFLAFISIIVVGTLLNPTGAQFLMTFY